MYSNRENAFVLSESEHDVTVANQFAKGLLSFSRRRLEFRLEEGVRRQGGERVEVVVVVVVIIFGVDLLVLLVTLFLA